MWHAIATSMALLAASQARDEVKAVPASAATGWLAPTRVRVDFRDRSPAEMVDGINAQGTAMLAVRPERRVRIGGELTRPEPPPRRYTLREAEPITFWEAVDRVAAASQTWPETGNTLAGRRGILLVPGSAERGFVANDGAFRVVLTGMYYQSNFQFAPIFDHLPSPEQPRADGSSRRPSLNAVMTIMAEPRLEVIRPVELVIREAVDDKGHSLVGAVPRREPLSKGPARSFPNQEHVWIGLLPLDDPGEKITRLAGSVILEAAPEAGGSPSATVEVRFDFADVPLP